MNFFWQWGFFNFNFFLLWAILIYHIFIFYLPVSLVSLYFWVSIKHFSCTSFVHLNFHFKLLSHFTLYVNFLGKVFHPRSPFSHSPKISILKFYVRFCLNALGLGNIVTFNVQISHPYKIKIHLFSYCSITDFFTSTVQKSLWETIFPVFWIFNILLHNFFCFA